MSQYLVHPAPQGVSVRFLNGPGTPRPGQGVFQSDPRSVGTASARRLTAWIIRTIMVATAGFALLDLFLLASVHH
jgi:hypothetical protein